MDKCAGCLDPDDETCAEQDVMNPRVHFTVETWIPGVKRASMLPQEKRPLLLSVLDYTLVDQYFVWPGVVEKGIKASLSLDYYRSYQPPHMAYEYFHPWRSILQYAKQTDIVNGKEEMLIARCSEQDNENSYLFRHPEKYTEVTGDDQVRTGYWQCCLVSPVHCGCEL